ncbi:hypothetical protein HPP92_023077 [Vanilla planifolia]|uniref:Uncharacterized protein n=1 Tax=Vanilla planifolia TaxID=51239 RepID=A0A835PSP2_VANPL|nr:hypothetical protein HPP92_023077 [Vanilla planifolia]
MEAEACDQEGPNDGRLLSGSLIPGGEQLKAPCWERLLPRRSIRVLLVEHDDSTRHIVAALLRKCSYRVAAVADGLQAWKMMQEKSNIFDLVLTEVDSPTLSGIDLLTNIIRAEECKNIPVIMMSVKDSVGIVLKCMLKGAADFLVKPVRKNELRNLWQHSNSNAHALDFNAAINHVSLNGGGFSQTGENSEEIDDNCMGRKPDAVLDAAQVQPEPTKIQGPSRKRKDRQGLTGNGTNTLASSSMKTDVAGLTEKNSETGEFENLPIQVAHAVDNICYSSGTATGLHCQIRVPQNAALNDQISHANGQIYCDAMKSSALEENRSPEAVGSSQMKVASISSMPPIFGLSSRRALSSDGEIHRIKEKRILNHSNASAFSRYSGKDGSNACQMSSSSMACFRTSECIDQSQSHDNHGCANSRSNSLCYCSMSVESQPDLFAGTSGSEYNVHLSKLGFMQIPTHGAVPFPSLHIGYGTMFNPMFYQDSCLIPWNSNAKGQFQVLSFQTGRHVDGFSCHSIPVRYHYDLNRPISVGGKVNQREVVEQRDIHSILNEQVNQHARCSTDILEGCGINISCGKPEAAKAELTILELENGIENFSRKDAYSNISYREAALMKFQLKRKVRCFEKKVRYHNRKRLAEQRPRVKGQFVRQKNP